MLDVKSPYPDYLGRLAAMRRQNPLVHQQTWRVVQSNVQKDVIVLGKDGSSDVFLLINRGEKPIQVEIPVNGQHQYIDLMTKDILQIEQEELRVSIAPVSAMLVSAI